jgi:hypothetical protein
VSTSYGESQLRYQGIPQKVVGSGVPDGPTQVIIEPGPNGAAATFLLEKMSNEAVRTAADMASGQPPRSQAFATASMTGLAGLVNGAVQSQTEQRTQPATRPSAVPASVAAPAVAPTAPSAVQLPSEPEVPLVDVTFELQGGFVVEGTYHDLIVQGHFMVLAYDHRRGGSVCRPGASSEPVAMHVRLRGTAPEQVYLVVPTGCNYRHRDWEYCIFVIAEQRYLES